jgi:antitoxin component HigA of HigAB toxin-antitoxin module
MYYNVTLMTEVPSDNNPFVELQTAPELSEAQRNLLHEAAIEVGVAEASVALRGLAHVDHGSNEAARYMSTLSNALTELGLRHTITFPEHEPLRVIYNQSQELGMTQKALAEFLGLSDADLSRFLNGRRNPSDAMNARFRRALESEMLEVFASKTGADTDDSTTT